MPEEKQSPQVAALEKLQQFAIFQSDRKTIGMARAVELAVELFTTIEQFEPKEHHKVWNIPPTWEDFWQKEYVLKSIRNNDLAEMRHWMRRALFDMHRIM